MGCTSSKGASDARAHHKEKVKDPLMVRDKRLAHTTPFLRAEDFKVGAYIQTGAMGKVYKGIRLSDQKPVAMKFFGYTDKTPDITGAYEEINLMTDLRGVPGLVQMMGVFMDTADGVLEGKRFKGAILPVIVMELLVGGDLMDRILMNQFVTEKQLATIFRGIIETLKNIHSRGFIHRDLKLENIIFESNKPDAMVKIVDFGMMVKLDKGKTKYHTILIQGTPGYLAPESITEMEYSPKTDFFAAACCFFAMLSGEMAFDPADPRAPAYQKFAPMTGKAWEKISEEAKSFLAFMLEADKEKRPNADEILSHPWLSGDANDENLDTEYFSRLKNLALRQKIRSFFIDNNIWDNNRKRQQGLNRVVPSFHRYSHQNRVAGLGTVQEWSEVREEFEYKLHRLRAVVVKTLKPDFCFKELADLESATPSTPGTPSTLGPNSPFQPGLSRERQKSVSSVTNETDAELTELSKTFRRHVLANGEIPFEGFVELLKCVDLNEFANKDVFNIFDHGKTDSIDMKDFLLTMLAMKSFEDSDSTPLLPENGIMSLNGNADNIVIPRRSTAIRLVDDAKLYFDMFDVKQTGYIDIDEVKLVIEFMLPKEDNSNKEALNAHVEEMFKFMDQKQNGCVDLQEFKEFYKAVMVATTQLNVNPAQRRISFAKAIVTAQSRANSEDVEEMVAKSKSSEGDVDGTPHVNAM